MKKRHSNLNEFQNLRRALEEIKDQPDTRVINIINALDPLELPSVVDMFRELDAIAGCIVPFINAAAAREAIVNNDTERLLPVVDQSRDLDPMTDDLAAQEVVVNNDTEQQGVAENIGEAFNPIDQVEDWGIWHHCIIS